MMNSRLFCFVVLGLFLSSCSVYKATSNEGVSISDVEDCSTRICLLSQGMKSIEKKEVDGVVTEIFKAVSRKSGVNYLRAAGHGILDVCSLGLWEVAATPIEGAADNNRGFILVRTTRKSDSEKLDSIEIFDEDGDLAVKKRFVRD